MNGRNVKTILFVLSLVLSAESIANPSKMMNHSAGCMACHQPENMQMDQQVKKIASVKKVKK